MSKTPLFFSFVSEDVLEFSLEMEGNQQCIVPSLCSVGDFRRRRQEPEGGRLVLGAESGTGALGCGLPNLASLPQAGP